MDTPGISIMRSITAPLGGQRQRKAACALSHAGEGERGWLCNRNDVSSGEGPTEVTSPVSWESKIGGDTLVMSSDSTVRRKREKFGDVVGKHRTDKSDFTALNIHPRSTAHAQICCPHADIYTRTNAYENATYQ